MPGGVDIHVQFLPDRMQEKVWAWFDRHRDPGGRALWPIAYRGPAGERAQQLRALKLRAWPALVYAHRPGMAAWLNDWALRAASVEYGCVPSATFYAEPSADADVAQALERGARVFKVHFEVGGFDPAAPVLRPVWKRLAAAGVPVVLHAGGAPVPGPYTGSAKLAEILTIAPDLVAVVAHMGMPEYEAFLHVALAHEHVHLDTTIVLGSDFPSIPHTYAHQVAVLVRLGLGDDWLRAVVHDNGARLLTR